MQDKGVVNARQKSCKCKTKHDKIEMQEQVVINALQQRQRRDDCNIKDEYMKDEGGVE